MDTLASKLMRPWNKGQLVGQKRPLLPREVWSIRVRLEMSAPLRDVALFNLAIDSKLRACDLVRLEIEDVCSGQAVRGRARVTQMKTGRRLLADRLPADSGYLFTSRSATRPHISTRQYARIVHRWIRSIGLDDRVRNAFTPPHKGCANLSQDRESEGCSAASRAR
jgi:hypothetical protein